MCAGAVCACVYVCACVRCGLYSGTENHIVVQLGCYEHVEHATQACHNAPRCCVLLCAGHTPITKRTTRTAFTLRLVREASKEASCVVTSGHSVAATPAC